MKQALLQFGPEFAVVLTHKTAHSGKQIPLMSIDAAFKMIILRCKYWSIKHQNEAILQWKHAGDQLLSSIWILFVFLQQLEMNPTKMLVYYHAETALISIIFSSWE